MEVAATEVIAVAAGALLLVGFVCGYGVRALISRWRHVKATQRRFERMAEQVMRTREQDRLAITFQRGDSTQAPPEG